MMPDEGPWKFELPLPTNLGNARLHHMQKVRLKNKWYGQADERVTNGLAPHRPPKPLEHAIVRIHFCIHNPMDRDNLGARCKWVLDWLVTRGYIMDDSDKVLTDWLPPTQEVDRKNKRVEVTVSAT